MNTAFFELLQVAIGTKFRLTSQLTDVEWASMYSKCKKQSLIGVAFVGITKLPRNQRPPMVQFAQWIHDAERLKEKNRRITILCPKVSSQLTNDGFWNCVLKGQGNLPNYPEDIRDYRHSGDIDIWAAPQKKEEVPHSRDNTPLSCNVKALIEYSLGLARKNKCDIPEVRYNHVELPHVWDVDVEIHHRPTFLFCPIRNLRMQEWFRHCVYTSDTAEVNGNCFPVPTLPFNAVYQLSHIYRHLFDEGIGLRQILDYYFVLAELHKKYNSAENDKILKLLGSFGMRRFASSMMYVLQAVFAMPDEFLICKPNAKEGKFLLHEILMAGNFGKYDKRIKHDGGQVRHAWEKTKHNLRLLSHYPEEVMWEPVFRLYHYFWRRFELWRL